MSSWEENKRHQELINCQKNGNFSENLSREKKLKRSAYLLRMSQVVKSSQFPVGTPELCKGPTAVPLGPQGPLADEAQHSQREKQSRQTRFVQGSHLRNQLHLRRPEVMLGQENHRSNNMWVPYAGRATLRQPRQARESET